MKSFIVALTERQNKALHDYCEQYGLSSGSEGIRRLIDQAKELPQEVSSKAKTKGIKFTASDKHLARIDELAEAANVVGRSEAVRRLLETLPGAQIPLAEKLAAPGRGTYLTYKGRTQPIAAWARELGLSRATVWNRYNSKMTVEDILSPELHDPGRQSS